MQQPWVPQVNITQELVATLICQQFPELKINSLKLFGSGWDNTLYLLNDEYVFRLPHRKEAIKWLFTELNALPDLVEYLSVSIPVPLFIGKPTQEYPFIFYAYKLLPGKSFGNFSLTKDSYKTLAVDLGLFLKKLHGLSLDFAQEKKLTPEPAKIDFKYCVARALEALQIIIKYNLLPEYLDKNKINDFIKSWDILEISKDQVIVHGDLYARHVLINQAGTILGIIDWGDLHVGAAGIDLGIVYWMLPLEYHQEFFKVYGIVFLNDTLKIAQFRAFYVALRLLVYGHEMHDKLIMYESLFCIENVLKALK